MINSGGPEQFDASYSDDSYGLDIDSIIKMFGTDMSPAQYNDEKDMMSMSLDGKEMVLDLMSLAISWGQLPRPM